MQICLVTTDRQPKQQESLLKFDNGPTTKHTAQEVRSPVLETDVIIYHKVIYTHIAHDKFIHVDARASFSFLRRSRKRTKTKHKIKCTTSAVPSDGSLARFLFLPLGKLGFDMFVSSST